MQRWAHIKNGLVDNVSLWDGDVSRWTPPEDVNMVPAPDFVGIGWTYDGVDWTAPVPAPEPEPEIVQTPTEK